MDRGIDVSSAQGNINWNLVEPNIDFAIIHINSGMTQAVETKFLYNATECERLGIPYGAYWFCYDLTVQDAYNSGVAAGQILTQNGLNITYPVFYDVEATGDFTRPGSYENWINNGITVTTSFVQSLILAFCQGVQSQGYTAGLYFNQSFYYQYDYATLLVNNPTIVPWVSDIDHSTITWVDWDFWQYSWVGTINGISGTVDLDYKNDNYNPPTPPTPTGEKKLPIWMYLKFPF